MTPSLKGWQTKATEAPPHEVRLTPLDTNPVFQCLEEMFKFHFFVFVPLQFVVIWEGTDTFKLLF